MWRWSRDGDLVYTRLTSQQPDVGECRVCKWAMTSLLAHNQLHRIDGSACRPRSVEYGGQPAPARANSPHDKAAVHDSLDLRDLGLEFPRQTSQSAGLHGWIVGCLQERVDFRL